MADAGYEPLKNKQQEERPDNAASSIINIDPEVVSGTPVFRGTRVPVRILTDNRDAAWIISWITTPLSAGTMQFIGLAAVTA